MTKQEICKCGHDKFIYNYNGKIRQCKNCKKFTPNQSQGVEDRRDNIRSNNIEKTPIIPDTQTLSDKILFEKIRQTIKIDIHTKDFEDFIKELFLLYNKEIMKKILGVGDRIFYSEDYANDDIPTEWFDYASKKWDKMKDKVKQEMGEELI